MQPDILHQSADTVKFTVEPNVLGHLATLSRHEAAISTHDYDWVDNEMVERRSAATKVSTGERRRDINKEYCCPYTQLMLFHVTVQKI
jgi:hypothetical protein